MSRRLIASLGVASIVIAVAIIARIASQSPRVDPNRVDIGNGRGTLTLTLSSPDLGSRLVAAECEEPRFPGTPGSVRSLEPVMFEVAGDVHVHVDTGFGDRRHFAIEISVTRPGIDEPKIWYRAADDDLELTIDDGGLGGAISFRSAAGRLASVPPSLAASWPDRIKGELTWNCE